MTTTGDEPTEVLKVTPSRPYAGPRALRQGEPIYGRVREINELRGAILSERIVLLYSQSGAGKTSLIEAGLRPEFERRRFNVLPTVRVGYESPLETPEENRYRLSVLTSLESARAAEDQLPPDELALVSLKEYFQTIFDAEPDLDLFVVFDQFEEIFTLDPTDWDEKESFLRELGAAMANRSIFALFSMREDFIAQLDPYQASMPTRFSNTYRLELLGPSDARLAIQKPAEAAGVEFADDAAQGLVDDLRRVRVDRGATSSLELGPSVEPVQLQVVCAQLWEHLESGATVIRSQNVDDIGNVNEALAGYYASQVASVAGSTRVKERAIRDWFEEDLISEDGFRTQTREGPGPKSDGKVLSELENAHLIRADRRRGAQWFELTHDRFVEPIRVSNAEFHRRRRKKLLVIVIPVALLILMGLTSFLVEQISTAPAPLEVPAEQLEGTSGDTTSSVVAGEVKRYRFDDAERFDVVTLVVSADSSSASVAGVPDVEVRLIQPGSETTAAEDIRVLPYVSTIDGALLEGTPSDDAIIVSTTTTGTSPNSGDRNAPQETVRRLEHTYSLPVNGHYFIEVISSTGGTIELSYDRMAGVQASDTQFGEPQDGLLSSAEPVGRFDFTVGDDETIELTLDSLDPLDGVLTLVDDTGGIVDAADFTAVAEREILVVRLTNGGTYTAEVSGYGTTLGAYVLEMRRPEIMPIAADSSVPGTTPSDGGASVYSFVADEGETVIVTLTYGPEEYPYLEVTSDSGRQYGRTSVDGLSTGVAQLWPGGEGILVVSNPFGPQGDFDVTFERHANTAIDVEESFVGSGQNGSLQYFSFLGSKGDTYAVDVSGAASVTAIFAPGDVVVVSEVFVAPFDGDYLVEVVPDDSADFSVLITRPRLETIAHGSSRTEEAIVDGQSLWYTFDAQTGDTYSITAVSDGSSISGLILVTAPDGILEVVDQADLAVGDLYVSAVAPLDGTYLITFIPSGRGIYTVTLDS